MNTTIKIAAYPLDIAWCDCEANLRSVEMALSTLHPDTDILVLPELFTTGFVQDPALIENLAKQSDESFEQIRNWCKQFNLAISGSVLVKDCDGIKNRGFFIEPSGEEMFYDKRHLFCLSPESKIFSGGHQIPPVVRFRGWNISLIVCYDLRFPVWCRNRSNRYDILIIPANWPVSRAYAWKHLLIARAIENQCLVVGANRSGCDDYGVYDNLSYIFDAYGRSISLEGSNIKESSDVLYAQYSRDELLKVRKRLPVVHDADEFAINMD